MTFFLERRISGMSIGFVKILIRGEVMGMAGSQWIVCKAQKEKLLLMFNIIFFNLEMHF